jgi:multidrug resistance efflux pump
LAHSVIEGSVSPDSTREDGGSPAVISLAGDAPHAWTPAAAPPTPAADARPWRLHAVTLEMCVLGESDAVLELVLAEAVELSGADGGSLWVAEDDGQLRCMLACGDVPSRRGGSGPARADVEQLTDHAQDVVATALIRADGSVRAVVRVERDPAGGRPFDESDRRCVAAVAAGAGAALEIGEHLRTATTRTRSFALVAEMSREITATLDLDRVLRAVVNLGARALTFDRGAVALYEKGECDIRAVAGADKVDRNDPGLKDLAVRAAWAAGVKQSFYLSDRSDPGSDAERIFAQLFGSDLDTDGVRSGLYLPLTDEEGVVGILLFESAVTEFADAHQRELAGILANQATVAIRNAHLYSQVPLADVFGALGEKKRALLAVPRKRRLTIAAAVLLASAALTFVRWPLRVTGDHAMFRAEDRLWARPLAPGVVERVLVSEGSIVQRGDPLVQLRATELRAARDALTSAASAAERSAALAARSGDAAAEQVERLRAASSRQEASALEEQVRAAVVRTPISGVVLTARPEERVGTYVEAGEALLMVGRTDTLELELTIGQRDLALVRVGDPVRLRVDALPQRTFSGHVVSVAALPADAVGDAAFPVRVSVPNDEGLLRPGMTPYVRVLTAPTSIAGRLLRGPVRWARLMWWRMWG